MSVCFSAVAKRAMSGAPQKLECFIDGKKVLVDPGTTVLQVRLIFFKRLLVEKLVQLERLALLRNELLENILNV